MNTVLVIEDDELMRLTVKCLIESDDCRVILSNCGEGGLGIARAEMPDLILLDLGLPDIDGFAVLRELKETTSTSLIPVIVITALSDEEAIKQAIYQYNAEYITKPFEAETLKAIVSHTLAGLDDGSSLPL